MPNAWTSVSSIHDNFSSYAPSTIELRVSKSVSNFSKPTPTPPQTTSTIPKRSLCCFWPQRCIFLRYYFLKAGMMTGRRRLRTDFIGGEEAMCSHETKSVDSRERLVLKGVEGVMDKWSPVITNRRSLAGCLSAFVWFPAVLTGLHFQRCCCIVKLRSAHPTFSV